MIALLALVANAEDTQAVCPRVVAAVQAGLSEADVVAMIEAARPLHPSDAACLSYDNTPEYVHRAALGAVPEDGAAPVVGEPTAAIVRHGPTAAIVRHDDQLTEARPVRAGGLDALPTHPIEVFALVPDPCSIAAAQGGLMGALGAGACMLGGSGMVSSKVEDQILTQARAALAAQGVTGEVRFGQIEHAALTGTYWQGVMERRTSIPAGTHYAIGIRIPDAVAAARAAKGDLLVGLGARVGMDIARKAENTVRQTVWTQLAANGITSYLIEP